jgi:hypothetical protein
MHNLVVIVSFSAFLTCLVQGLRSRPAPRWLAIAALLSIIVVVEDAWWQLGCGGAGARVLMGCWYLIVALMFLHHSLQAGSQLRQWIPRSRFGAILCRSAAPAFVGVLLRWCVFRQLVMLLPNRESTAILVAGAGHLRAHGT